MPRKQLVCSLKYWTQSCYLASLSDDLVLPKNVANRAFYISKEIAEQSVVPRHRQSDSHQSLHRVKNQSGKVE